MPSLTNITPIGQAIDQKTPVGFDVLNAGTRTIVTIQFPELQFTEIVYDGAFTEAYSPTSSVTSIAMGNRFSVLRNPVWPGTPVVVVYAFDGGTEL